MSAPDIQASLENADEIAKLTGRSKGDIIADLLDDGKLNNSNAIKENTSALDRATEMAGKTHKLLTAIIPILILLAGSGLELGGIIDLTPAGEGDDWAWEDNDPYADVYWGCTDSDAENYDYYATDDDGSCYYYTEPSGDITDMEASLTPDNDLKIEFYLYADGYFDDDIEIVWVLALDGEEKPEHEITTYEYAGDIGHVEYYWSELEAGEWIATVEAIYNNTLLDAETFPPVTIEANESEENCTGSFYNPEVKLVEQNNTTDMEIYWDADWSCDEEIYVEIDIYIMWTDNQSYYYSNFAGYNITGSEVDRKYFTKMNVPKNDSFDVVLSFWVEVDGKWRNDDSWQQTSIKT